VAFLPNLQYWTAYKKSPWIKIATTIPQTFLSQARQVKKEDDIDTNSHFTTSRSQHA
jgi:hypothetical protein